MAKLSDTDKAIAVLRDEIKAREMAITHLMQAQLRSKPKAPRTAKPPQPAQE